MFGKKKISDPPPPVENDQLSTEALDKHRQIICRSELVANEDDLAVKIIGMSRLVKFDKGQVLMTHGEDADDVYFILFGSVRVSINSTFIDTREDFYLTISS